MSGISEQAYHSPVACSRTLKSKVLYDLSQKLRRADDPSGCWLTGHFVTNGGSKRRWWSVVRSKATMIVATFARDQPLNMYAPFPWPCAFQQGARRNRTHITPSHTTVDVHFQFSCRHAE